MKQAVIDIGSNSVRLTLYAIDETWHFKILFREKIMAGLAGYVENGSLTQEGIACAIAALDEFRQTLKLLDICHVAVFATASLRNIRNTAEALLSIEAASGLTIEVLSGEEEAALGYWGAMQELHPSEGVFVDVGGASTEVVTFAGGAILGSKSFRVGSLSLYKSCVRKILPGDGAQKRISQAIADEMKGQLPKGSYTQMLGVGGTCRAVLKLAKKHFGLPQEIQSITREQLEDLCAFLCQGDREAAELILRTEAERIHTLVPGILILRHIMEHYESKELIICKYGVREGYLCQKILREMITTPKTGN